MGLIARIIIGGLGTALGFFLVSRTESWMNTFGRIPWAEKHMGTMGGSRMMYKLIGIFFIFLSFIYMTGMWGSFMGWVTSPLTKRFQ